HAQVDSTRFHALEWRMIGPYRGGRVTAVAGHADQPLTYYMGATGGGVWKTTDAGNTWENITDGHLQTGSVGAVAVAPSDPNVIYVGMGERCIRGVATSSGDGVYRSTDGGKSWQHLGLEETLHIAAIEIHPQDPDRVYVAAQGNPYRPSEARGIYRSENGGRTWEKVLSGDPKAGASDLALDPTNPRILYAGFWEHQRLPWKIVSGGPSSGVFKSSDGGDTWKRLDQGLPELMGKVAVDVSPADPDRVWAMVEAEEGGLYRSDDGGESFQLVNSDRVLRARAWYYIHVYADPLDPDTVYVLNAPFMKSIDGGKSFTPVSVPHGDNHDLWIHPEDSRVMVNANDGGANVSFNGGETWSTQTNQPTAQFYRVIADDRWPYWLYAGQQDNTSVAIASRSFGTGIGREDWHPVGGCESAWVAFDPDDPRLTYATCIVGGIDEYDQETEVLRSVMAYEFLGLGMSAEEMPYRFNWNNPVVASPHDPSVIYHAANVVLQSSDRGVSWEEISPDLTRDEPEKQGPGGGPITNEAAGGEVYNTILYLVESPHEAGVIWVGTDDGLVQLTRDGGESWTNVTPKGLPESMINSIEVSPHDPATAWIAVTRYKFGDFSPMAYVTRDYGASWRSIAADLPEGSFVRVVREDPVRPGLLYAGTETGVRVSFDGGESWQSLQLDLPVVPITDLTIRDGDLVAATQGRAFWILDDLSPLRQLTPEVEESGFYLFEPRPAHRIGGGGFSLPRRNLGENPKDGIVLHYLLEEDLGPDSEEELVLEILAADGHVLRRVSHKPQGEAGPVSPFFQPPPRELPAKAGMNRWVWNFRRDDLVEVKGLFSFGPLMGPMVPPGSYSVRLTLGERQVEQPVEVVPDPRRQISPEEWDAQQEMLLAIADRVSEIHQTVLDMREVKTQVEALLGRVERHTAAEALEAAGRDVVEAIDALEAGLVQVKSQTFQDIINFPNQLNMDYMDLMGKVDGSAPPVNQGMRRRLADLEAEWAEHQAERDRILTDEVAAFNALFAEHGVPAVILPTAGAPEEASDAVEGDSTR
ncbi:MAG: glycosyl hydrolase, partial [Thermoanaerobaculia bacterium]|nr:glycosyl hydrolase [Thermoanaerobaculia bacterium]